MSDRLQGIAAGVIRAPKNQPLSGRLRLIHDGLCEVIEIHQSACMAVEDVFAKYARSALQLGQARGVILLAVWCGIRWWRMRRLGAA